MIQTMLHMSLILFSDLKRFVDNLNVAVALNHPALIFPLTFQENFWTI